jgi:type IV fimbrial biogenesis protein FimT
VVFANKYFKMDNNKIRPCNMVFRKRVIFQSGFTLIEVMVVIAIVSIVSTVAISNISDSLPGFRLRSAVRDIVSCLQEVKMRAVKENADTYIFFDVTNNEYKAWVDNGAGGGVAGNGLHESDETYFNEVTLTTGIEFYQNTSFSSNTFGFNSRGLPATTVGSVFIKNNKSVYMKIIVSTAGNIRVVKSSDGINFN